MDFQKVSYSITASSYVVGSAVWIRIRKRGDFGGVNFKRARDTVDVLDRPKVRAVRMAKIERIFACVAAFTWLLTILMVRSMGSVVC